MASITGVSEKSFGEDPLRWVRSFARARVLALLLFLAACVAGALLFSTLLGMAPFGLGEGTVTILVMVNFAVVLLLAALVASRLVGVFMARRSGLAGARLHGKLATRFALVAVAPAIVLATFAALSFSRGVELWFSERIQTAFDTALAVSREFVLAHRQTLSVNMLNVATTLNTVERSFLSQSDEFQSLISRLASEQGLDGVYIIDAGGTILVQTQKGIQVPTASSEGGAAVNGDQPTYIFPEIFEVPRPEGSEGGTQDAFALADAGKLAIWDNGTTEFRGLVKLDYEDPVYLYAVRLLDPQVISYLVQTRDAKFDYERAERNQTALQIQWALAYSVAVLLVLLVAIGSGFRAANRIVSPIGRLVDAAEQVSEGNLAVRVDVGPQDDELGTLGRAFNRMTGQLESQRDELIEANRQFDLRRRFTEAVLSGVTAGVIGLDGDGDITLVNRSGTQLLSADLNDLAGHPLRETVPEFAPLLDEAFGKPEGIAQQQIDLVRAGHTRNLMVRVARDPGADDAQGFVITFDDITELVAAQRMSAWADVARRIAHEIKNPLTPIQLSAERLRRKYRNEVESDPAVFEQCTETIIRQVSDIGRMVDEFSSFARMPAPVVKPHDLSEIVRQAVFLQRVAVQKTVIDMRGVDEKVVQVCDGRLISQAVTNLLKNAAEAVSARLHDDANGVDQGQILIVLSQDDAHTTIQVVDNGCGLPEEGRNRLTEPYMTTRSKGTGLGLAIVKKIMEDHGGTLTLEDADKAEFADGALYTGAWVKLRIPREIVAVKTTSEADVQQELNHGA